VEESEEDVFIPGAQAKAKARLQSTIGGKTSGVPPTPITSSTKSAKKERTQAIQVAKAAVDSKARSHPAVRPTPQSPPLQPTNAKSAADVSYILAHRFIQYVFSFVVISILIQRIPSQATPVPGTLEEDCGHGGLVGG